MWEKLYVAYVSPRRVYIEIIIRIDYASTTPIHSCVELACRILLIVPSTEKVEWVTEGSDCETRLQRSLLHSSFYITRVRLFHSEPSKDCYRKECSGEFWCRRSNACIYVYCYHYCCWCYYCYFSAKTDGLTSWDVVFLRGCLVSGAVNI